MQLLLCAHIRVGGQSFFLCQYTDRGKLLYCGQEHKALRACLRKHRFVKGPFPYEVVLRKSRTLVGILNTTPQKQRTHFEAITVVSELAAQSPKGGIWTKDIYKRHPEVCAIYSETTVFSDVR